MTAIDALAVVATEYWKVAHRLLRLAGTRAPDLAAREQAQARYGLDRVIAALAAAGLVLESFNGREFSADVVAEPVNAEDFGATDRLVVGETLEPAIRHDGRIVMRGKVLLRHREA